MAGASPRSSRRCAADPRARRRRAARGRPRAARGRAGARLASTTRRRCERLRSARRTCSGRFARTPSGPRRPPTRSCRCWPPTPACARRCTAGSPRTGGASAAGGAASGCPSAPTRRGWRRCSARQGVRACASSSRSTRGGLVGAPAPARRRARGRARADRPGHDRARVERPGLPGRRCLPRLPPPHHLPPQPLEQRRRGLRPRRRGGARPRARGRLRGPHPRATAGGGAGGAGPLPGGGLVVCALDTELLGHWWYEGVAWLAAVVEECRRPGPCAGAPRRRPCPDRAAALPAGRGTSGAPAAGARTGTCRRGRSRASPSSPSRRARPSWSCCGVGPGLPAAALRELLALQSSDWAFLITRELAVSYARERFEGHRAGLARALSGARRRGAELEPCATSPATLDPATSSGPRTGSRAAV